MKGEHLTLDFEGRIIHVSVGKVQSPPPGQEVISKWGSQDKHDPTILNWQMRLNYSRRLLNNLKLVDTWSDNQDLWTVLCNFATLIRQILGLTRVQLWI